MSTVSKKLTLCLIAIALVAGIWIVYFQVYDFEFVNFDDTMYIHNNEMVRKGLTWDSIRWAFLSTGYNCNWHPLTWLSHMLDIELYDMHAGGHHITNIILHTANTVLLFFVFYAMTAAVWRSALVAALFALHPLHVESIAWVAERKDVLSTLFWMLTMLCYVYYTFNRKKGWYILALLAFAIGLTAKAMLVTLPGVMLLMDYWPLKRLHFNHEQPVRRGRKSNHQLQGTFSTFANLVAEKIPFLLLAVLASIITFIAQQRGGNVQEITALPFSVRIFNAFNTYSTYISNLLYPVNLANFYPYPPNVPVGLTLFSILVLFFITGAVFLMHQKRRYLLVGWLWYIGTLIPVIGLVQVGEQARADRYTYIPLIGLFTMISWGLGECAEKRPALKRIAAAAGFAALVMLSILSFKQAGYWRSSSALFSHAIAVTENNYEAHFGLSETLQQPGRIDEAIAHLRTALAIKGDYLKGLNGMGAAFITKGQSAEAIPYLLRAVEIKPDFFAALTNLGIAYKNTGSYDAALSCFRRALEFHPSKKRLLINMVEVFVLMGREDEAEKLYQSYLHYNLNRPAIQ